ncbi:cytochrome P450 [Lipingzhangella sp. LS1_29]|uniref:Cytochrome P450 n=1 Tax=Lipingzhangella rawalii TaxID=2055835 RepID=A0ABU2HBL1_9ACTN|nr:cytochrome P450 [Lipingzhangella rawalii]MDS1272698.1 cytochrome P450 [Lipingzhangella rawalii]
MSDSPNPTPAAAEDTPLPPGPSSTPLTQAVRFLRDPLGSHRADAERYGPVHTVSMPGGFRMAIVSDPTLAHEVFATDRDIGLAGRVRTVFLEPIVGRNSLLTLDGDEWMRQRKMLGSAFHGRRVERYATEMAEVAARHVDTWPTGTPFALRPRFQDITLEIILRVVFGVSDTDRLRRLTTLVPPLLRSMDALNTQMMFLPIATWRRLDPWLRHVPGTPNAKFARLRRATDTLIYTQITEHRRATDLADRDDILSALLRARDPEGNELSDLELRDALVTLLLAGHETTATTLAWCFERLMRTPEVHDRARRAAATGDTDYLEAVAKEALRSRPVVPDMPRVLTQPMNLGGYHIPKGWWVAPSALATHHAPEHFPEPEEFRPERFQTGEIDPQSWIPFGGGRRQCLGAQFALLELRAILPEVLRRVLLHAPAGAPGERLRMQHVTLVPQRDARAVAAPVSAPE